MAFSGDTITYSFDTIYLIEDTKTTQTYTFTKEGVKSGTYTANDIAVQLKEIFDERATG